jgi:hypothetical protein
MWVTSQRAPTGQNYRLVISCHLKRANVCGQGTSPDSGARGIGVKSAVWAPVPAPAFGDDSSGDAVAV